MLDTNFSVGVAITLSEGVECRLQRNKRNQLLNISIRKKAKD